jgi:hypothetical protein
MSSGFRKTNQSDYRIWSSDYTLTPRISHHVERFLHHFDPLLHHRAMPPHLPI